jgi:hypothetical protein
MTQPQRHLADISDGPEDQERARMSKAMLRYGFDSRLGQDAIDDK